MASAPPTPTTASVLPTIRVDGKLIYSSGTVVCSETATISIEPFGEGRGPYRLEIRFLTDGSGKSSINNRGEGQLHIVELVNAPNDGPVSNAIPIYIANLGDRRVELIFSSHLYGNPAMRLFNFTVYDSGQKNG